MNREKILLLDQIERETVTELAALFAQYEFIDARESEVREKHFAEATIMYGLPPIKRLEEARRLQWIQLLSAGVPRSLRPKAKAQNVVVTNLAGLYGPSIAEHTLAMMSMLCRNLHTAMWNQITKKWDNSIRATMTDLAGKTVAIIGMGNIGQCIGRLAQAYGMRVLGSRRTVKPTPYADRIYPMGELHKMLAEAEFIVVAAPLTKETENLLGEKEFSAMKKGAYYLNVSRGVIAEEPALLKALHTGHLAGAGLDVFAKEPLPENHPFWSMQQVIVSPHYSGDPVNLSSLPMELFVRNLRAWIAGAVLEDAVDLDLGY